MYVHTCKLNIVCEGTSKGTHVHVAELRITYIHVYTCIYIYNNYTVCFEIVLEGSVIYERLLGVCVCVCMCVSCS